MRNPAAVADHVQTLVPALQLFVHVHFHIIELNFYAVKERVVVRRPRRDFIERVKHFDNPIQNAFGEHQAQIPGSRAQRRRRKRFLYSRFRTSPAVNQIPKPLHDYAPAEHVAQPSNRLTVAVGVTERLGKMFGNEQREIRILRLLCLILVAVPVHGDDSVGVLTHHRASWIHTKRPHSIAVFLRSIYNFTFVQFVRQMRENFRRELHSHTDIHAVRFGGNLQFIAYLLHPFAPAAPYRHDTFCAIVFAVFANNPKPARRFLHAFYGCIEIKIHLIFELRIQVLEHDIIHVRAQMPNGRV